MAGFYFKNVKLYFKIVKYIKNLRIKYQNEVLGKRSKYVKLVWGKEL